MKTIFSNSQFLNATYLSMIAIAGVVLYVGFAYLVTRSNDLEARRRWRYSIVFGVSSGILISILFGIGSVLAFLWDENELGYMAVFRTSKNPLDLFIGIVLFLIYPILASLPIVFAITLVTYWKEIQRGDMFITRLIYPVKKHPSDQSHDNVLEGIRSYIAKLVER